MMEVLISLQYNFGNMTVNDANYIGLIFMILGIITFIAVFLQQTFFAIVGANLTRKLRIDCY